MSARRCDADALRCGVARVLPGWRVEVLERCSSTNALLVERARDGALEPTLLVALEQTQGRGRQGRGWHSARDCSLTFSVGRTMQPRDWQGLSLAVGAALGDALEPQGARLALKWPNDLWLRGDGGGRKLGGILIETVSSGDARAVVVGVGLNVRAFAVTGVDTGFASLDELDPAADPASVLQRVAAPLAQALERFETEGLPPFAAAFGRRDLLRGRAVSAPAAGVADGVAEGIDERGALKVRLRDGTIRPLLGGEVSVRPRAEVPE